MPSFSPESNLFASGLQNFFKRYMIIVQITDISYPHVPFYADLKNVMFAAQ